MVCFTASLILYIPSRQYNTTLTGLWYIVILEISDSVHWGYIYVFTNPTRYQSVDSYYDKACAIAKRLTRDCHMWLYIDKQNITTESKPPKQLLGEVFHPTLIIMQISSLIYIHDDVIKWQHFPPYWPFVWGIHRSPGNSQHEGQWRGALMFSLICVWINGWVNNREAGDLRRYRAHHDVTVMLFYAVNTPWHPAPSCHSFTLEIVSYNNIV